MEYMDTHNYCTTGRAIWGNIQLEDGSIGPTEEKGQYSSIFYSFC